jgi:hypothetical protein
MTEDSIPDAAAAPTGPASLTPAVPHVPAAWYPDPKNPALVRFWDGQRWTEHTAPGAQPQAAAPAVAFYGPRTVMSSDKEAKTVQASFAWLIAILTLGYMLPWAIAASRGKANAGAIGWLNFLLGWSIVGWIVALVMACGAHQTVAVSQ